MIKKIEGDLIYCVLLHDDLVNLVTSVHPITGAAIDAMVKMGVATWTGGFVDRFDWKKDELNKLDDIVLFDLYCKFKREIDDFWKSLHKPKD